MDLSGLSALMMVAEKRSFTAAAASLQVTPSAVSQIIRSLEERVGVRLLQRTTRSVGLTEAGQRFVQQLRPALAGVQSAFDAIAELRDGPAGTLRLNVPRAAYRQVIEPILPAFLEAHPHVQLEVIVDDAFANIIETGCDAGIRIGEMLDSEMVALRIGKDETTAIVGSPSYFAAHGKPKHPRDLARHECINVRRIVRNEIYRWEFTEHGKDFEISVPGSPHAERRRSLDSRSRCRPRRRLHARERGPGRYQSGATGSRARALLPTFSRLVPVLPEQTSHPAKATGPHRLPTAAQAATLSIR